MQPRNTIAEQSQISLHILVMQYYILDLVVSNRTI